MTPVERQLTVNELQSLIRLDAKTGLLYWRERPPEMFSKSRLHGRWNTRYAGTEALGTATVEGHKRGKIHARRYWSHRVVWALAHGAWPTGSIDHINGDSADNRPHNLRCVSSQENSRNQKLRSSNTSGVMGVTWRRNRSAWLVRCVDRNGKRRVIGQFKEFDKAVSARKQAERDSGYHENHGR